MNIGNYIKIFKGDYEDCAGRITLVQDNKLTVFIYHVSRSVYDRKLPLNNAVVEVEDCWCI